MICVEVVYLCIFKFGFVSPLTLVFCFLWVPESGTAVFPFALSYWQRIREMRYPGSTSAFGDVEVLRLLMHTPPLALMLTPGLTQCVIILGDHAACSNTIDVSTRRNHCCTIRWKLHLGLQQDGGRCYPVFAMIHGGKFWTGTGDPKVLHLFRGPIGSTDATSSSHVRTA